GVAEYGVVIFPFRDFIIAAFARFNDNQPVFRAIVGSTAQHVQQFTHTVVEFGERGAVFGHRKVVSMRASGGIHIGIVGRYHRDVVFGQRGGSGSLHSAVAFHQLTYIGACSKVVVKRLRGGVHLEVALGQVFFDSFENQGKIVQLGVGIV